MIEAGVLVAASIMSIFIGLSVYSKNPKNRPHIVYLLLSIVLVLWSVVNFYLIRSTSDQTSLLLMTLNFSIIVIQNTLFFIFCSIFPNRKIKFRKLFVLYLIFSLFLLLLVLSGNVIKSFENDKIVPAAGIVIFMLHSAVSVVGAFRNLYMTRKAKKSKGQITYLIYGSLILWVLVPITNFVIPIAFNYNFFVRLSALYVLMFTILIGYAILKFKLFNLRSFVARASVYIFTLSLFLFLYASAIILVNLVLFKNNVITASQQIIYASIAVFSAPLLSIIKREFDKISSRVFYRDSYDSQALIDELNQALVSNVGLDSLLTKSALILQENLKTTFATFYIRETSYFKPRIIGAHRPQPEFEDIDGIKTASSSISRRVIVCDDSLTTENERKLKASLESNDIEVMARLVSTLDYKVHGIGYLFLGPKKSGTPYSKQDLRIVEIVANELVIATENILRFEEIEQFNVTLQKKIDDATKELKQSNEKLRALDEAKDEFVSMASHQLRTPLTSIKGYISMVLEGDAGKINDVQKQMLGQAYFSSQRMVYLISDLLNVSRLKTGKFNIEAKPVYLPSLVDSEIQQLIEGAKSKNITLSFHKPDKFATLSLDEMKIRQVVMNFTDNAIYYTPTGGKIDIELKETPRSIEFTVKDTGIGVPKEQQHKLFVKFFRADNARKTRPDGTGLGLFMAKKVIIAQGGSMIFESRENKGSTFGFTFPKEKLEVEPKNLTAKETPPQK